MTSETTLIEDAVDAGIDAASEYVSSLEPNYDFCPVCGGDCSAANPPPINCPHGRHSPSEDAVEAGVEAAAEYVSSLPAGQRTWDDREYRIAEMAARAAIAALQDGARGGHNRT